MTDRGEIILCASLLFLLLSRNKVNPERQKRVIHGVPVHGRTTGYDAVNYYGAISTLHGLADYHVGNTIDCSCAVLTPEIVQTACHCLSTFDADKTNFFRVPSVDYHWEAVKVVYVGANERFGDAPSFVSVQPIRSKKFIVHQSCGKLPTNFITHDYGWMKVDPLWPLATSGVPTEGVSFAPLYAEEELDEIWKYNMRKRAMCLFIGFGLFWEGWSSLSEVLRHGWSVLLSPRECRRYTTDGIPKKNVSGYMSWFCTAPFKFHDQPAGEGDSGGPVSCNNYYFGVGSSVAIIAEGKRLWGTTKTISVPGGLAFALFENAYQYRKAFMKYVSDYGKYTFAELVGLIEVPTPTFRPKALSFQSSRASRCAQPALFTWLSSVIAVALLRCISAIQV